MLEFGGRLSKIQSNMKFTSFTFGIRKSICQIITALLLAGAVASAQNTNGLARPAMPFGPTLDVVPYVRADGYTIQLSQAAVDVSRFPSLDQLPGKVPRQVWNGLAGAWASSHARWAVTASNDVGAVVFLGDSITAGWNSLARDFPNFKVANRGIGGDLTSGVLYRLRADVLNLKPAAIVLLIGTNDIGNNMDPDDVAANIRLILQAIKEYDPKLKVIVCKVMPRADGGRLTFVEKIRRANSLVEEFVKGEPNFAICDTWSIYADETGAPNPADFNSDRLHLNAAGYKVWKTALDPVIAKLQLPENKAK